MAITTTITPFTKSPSRQAPSTFSSDMDTRLSEENSRITQMNSMSTEMNSTAATVNSDATTATTKAAEASASATTAVAASNVTKWISGTTYTEGNNVYSPVNFQTYRRKVTGAGTTDPSSDSTNWQRISVDGTALGITNTPAGNISATTVQGAINELDSEKVTKITSTANKLVKFSDTSSTIANSQITDNGTNVLVGTTTDNGVDKLQVNGSISAIGGINTKSFTGSFNTSATLNFDGVLEYNNLLAIYEIYVGTQGPSTTCKKKYTISCHDVNGNWIVVEDINFQAYQGSINVTASYGTVIVNVTNTGSSGSTSYRVVVRKIV